MPHEHMAKHAGKFIKHVLPAAIKPVHSLWHEIIGFIFLSLAGLLGWKVFHNKELAPWLFASLILFIVLMAVYGVSSFLKARRISRS
jgi:CDP-diglyceride synthetase